MSGLTASQSTVDSPAYKALANYINTSSSSLQDTRTACCEPVEKSATSTGNTPDDIEQQLGGLWTGVIALAASTPDAEARQRLVDLVLSIAQQADVEQNGQAYRVQRMTLWNDLPIFGWQLRDSWNNAASDDDSSEVQQQWINLNAFVACFVATAHAEFNNHPDKSLYGIWTVRTALEEEQQPPDAALAAAATWLINAAPALMDFSKQGKTFDRNVATAGSLFEDEEWRGFSNDRWRSWGQRLSEVQGAVQDTQTKQLVEEARRIMGEIKER